MRERIFNVSNVLIVILMLGCLTIPAQGSVQPAEISTQELKQKLDGGEDLVLVNVMPRVIHDSRHIKGSINIALGKIKTSTELPKEKDKLIVFYCMGPQ